MSDPSSPGFSGLGAPAGADTELVSCLAVSRGESVASRLRGLAGSGVLDLAPPGTGKTWERFRRLAEVAADDLSLARVSEGHCDALSILTEAGLDRAPDKPYAVWVAGPPLACETGAEGLVLSGTREYCSGYGMVERALVIASVDGGKGLFEVDAGSPAIEGCAGSWPAVGMAATNSVSLRVAGLGAIRQVGPDGFYEQRPGFWLGSLNVAACWYGGALGLCRNLARKELTQAWQFVLLAELDTALLQMRTMLQAAANEIDCDGPGTAVARELRALQVRDVVYRRCQEVLSAAAELGGTHASTRDPAQARRLADLPVYLRQHHPLRDRERLGTLLRELPGRDGE